MRNNKNEFNLWGDWNVCTFELLWLFFGKEVVFSKITPSLFTLKEGSTSHPDPLSSGAREETALLGAQNRFALRLADHQRSSPYFAGWDRLAVAGGDLMLHQSLRHVVRDGTALLKVDRIIEVLVL